MNTEIKAKFEEIQNIIDGELLKKSAYEGGVGINVATIESLERELALLNKMPMSIEAKVEMKKLQLRLNAYKNNSAVMKIAKESEIIGQETLSQIQVQTQQLHRIDSSVDSVDANVQHSHQIIKEMHRRRRRMYIMWSVLALVVMGVIIVALVLVLV